MILDFYNNAANVSYPFVDEDAYPFGAGTFELPDGAVVDAGILFGLDAEFIPATHKAWLSAVRLNGANMEFYF